MSPGLRAMNDQAAAAGPFAKAARLLENLAGVRLTVKRVERAAEASGTAAAAAVRDRAAMITARTLVPFPPSPLPDKLYAAIDGTGVPVTAKETAGRDGKGEDGRARTREVKLAVFFTQDKLDAKGYPVRDRDSSSYIATFEPAATFAGLVEAEGIRRGAGHVRQMTILGDGAAWIWNIATAKFPEATQIVDLFHAREHLHDLARSLDSCSATARTTGSPPAWRTSTTATSTASAPPPAPTPSRIKKTSWTRPWATSRTTPRACATTGSAPAACSSAPEPSNPAAKQSSASASNCQACTGPSPAPAPSPRSAASRPADPKTRSGNQHATRHQPPDQPNPLNDLDPLQK